MSIDILQGHEITDAEMLRAGLLELADIEEEGSINWPDDQMCEHRWSDAQQAHDERYQECMECGLVRRPE